MNKRLDNLVKNLDEKLLEKYRFDTEMFATLFEIQKQSGILHDDRPIFPFFRPHFFARSRYEKIKHAAENINLACERLTEVALGNAEILAEINMTEKEERMARLDPRYRGLCVSSRFDTYLNGDDFKFLEYNAETPAGIGDQFTFERVFKKIPEVQQFLAENKHWLTRPRYRLLEALDSAYRDMGGKKEKPNIAIVDWEGVSTVSEFEILRDCWQSERYNTIIATPFELEYDGKVLRVGDFEVDIFYKRVLIHEFLEKFDETHPLVRAYTDGNVCMANNFRVKIPHKKTSFAIMSDEKYEGIFTSKQLELIRKHIPWTRTVREAKTNFHGKEVDLLELLHRERENFILKPHDDYGGHGISFGWENSASDWNVLLENALKDCFIVQERVVVEKISIPTISGGELSMPTLNVDFDPFLFRGKVDGGLVRLSASSLVNVSAGGGETALVVMEDF
ncbi:hypothetical protein BH10ACI1_BH10ACI1_21050 [soil metagenome]